MQAPRGSRCRAKSDRCRNPSQYRFLMPRAPGRRTPDPWHFSRLARRAASDRGMDLRRRCRTRSELRFMAVYRIVRPLEFMRCDMLAQGLRPDGALVQAGGVSDAVTMTMCPVFGPAKWSWLSRRETARCTRAVSTPSWHLRRPRQRARPHRGHGCLFAHAYYAREAGEPRNSPL